MTSMMIRVRRHDGRLLLLVAAACAVTACGTRNDAAESAAEPAAAASVAAPTQAAADVAPAAPVADAIAPATGDSAVPKSWSPEALEELLAPVALYPDPVLSQVLIASTNPQEVLDAGNWLIANEGLKGKALDEAAAGVGFTPPIRALVQFPATVDMLCLQMPWTTELGEAFTADQSGVLGAVQRLRAQAVSVGNLQSSEQMQVVNTVQENKEVIVLKPAKPEVVYVPQYDPVVAYAPPPPPPPATTTAVPVASTPATTPTTAKSEGHSTGSLVMTGVLAFGAGMLVNELFDDDDDDRRYGYYYPNYGYGGMPYYPPYPYRPSYGNGFYPGNSYSRPPNYNSGFQNNGTIIVNTGGRPGGGYWDRWGANNRPGSPGYRPRTVNSPITAARSDRPELRELNQRAPRARPADLKGPSPTATAANWRGQSSYAGAKPGARSGGKAVTPADPRERIASATPAYSKPAAARPGAKGPAKPEARAKVQGGYAGARPPERPVVRETPKPRPTPVATSRESARPALADMPRTAPAAGASNLPRPDRAPSAATERGDRGYGQRGQSLPQRSVASADAGRSASRSSATSGLARGGAAESAASARGRQSLPAAAANRGATGRQAR